MWPHRTGPEFSRLRIGDKRRPQRAVKMPAVIAIGQLAIRGATPILKHARGLAVEDPDQANKPTGVRKRDHPVNLGQRGIERIGPNYQFGLRIRSPIRRLSKRNPSGMGVRGRTRIHHVRPAHMIPKGRTRRVRVLRSPFRSLHPLPPKPIRGGIKR